MGNQKASPIDKRRAPAYNLSVMHFHNIRIGRAAFLVGILLLVACAGQPTPTPVPPTISLPDALATFEPAPSAAPVPSPEPGLPTRVAPSLAPTAIVAPSPTPTIVNHLASFPNALVQFAWFYRTPSNVDLPTIARAFNLFVLSQPDLAARDGLKEQGVKTPMLLYLGFVSIDDPGSCTAQPTHNQAADQPGDFCVISRDHPDWFLRDKNGNLIREDEGGSYVMMDPGNPGWRAFWLVRARQLLEQSGWDGIFLDNVEASLGKRTRLGQVPAAYPTDAAYQVAVEGFLQYAYSQYFQPFQRPLMANIIESRDDAVWFRYLQYLDGAMEERFATDWMPRYQPVAQWEQDLNRAERAQALGKHLILVAQGDHHDTQKQQFAFASYLLITDGRAAFRYTNSDNYEQAWLYDNYAMEFGAPLGPRYRVGAAWKRDYAHASVTVDPQAHTGTITPR